MRDSSTQAWSGCVLPATSLRWGTRVLGCIKPGAGPILGDCEANKPLFWNCSSVVFSSAAEYESVRILGNHVINPSPSLCHFLHPGFSSAGLRGATQSCISKMPAHRSRALTGCLQVFQVSIPFPVDTRGEVLRCPFLSLSLFIGYTMAMGTCLGLQGLGC